MTLYLICNFETDGDFDFRNLHSDFSPLPFDPNKELYSGVDIEYEEHEDDYSITYELRCQGNEIECKWVARDLMQSLICNIWTFKDYLVLDLYNLIHGVEEALWKTNTTRFAKELSGNYDGTYVLLEMAE